MKKILTSLICCLSPLAYAENLKCENNYSKFEEIIQEKSNVVTISNEEEIHQFIQQYDYPFIFIEKSQNKRYWLNKPVPYAESSWYENKWISESEYNKRIKFIAKKNAKEPTNVYVHKLLSPKANFKSAVGEICVVPVQAYIRLDADEDIESSEELYIVAMRIDHIFVKGPNQQNWRVLEFNRNILDQDFNSFFPKFPENVKNQLDDGVVEAEEATAAYEESE